MTRAPFNVILRASARGGVVATVLLALGLGNAAAGETRAAAGASEDAMVLRGLSGPLILAAAAAASTPGGDSTDARARTPDTRARATAPVDPAAAPTARAGTAGRHTLAGRASPRLGARRTRARVHAQRLVISAAKDVKDVKRQPVADEADDDLASGDRAVTVGTGAGAGAPVAPRGTRLGWSRGGKPRLLWTGFVPRAGGGADIVLQTSAEVRLDTMPAKAGAVFVLRGCRVAHRNDRLPLETRFFDSPVTRVEIRPRGGDVWVTVTARQPNAAPPRKEAGPDGSWFWTVPFSATAERSTAARATATAAR